MMDIAQKLSWEIVALNDRGTEGSEKLAAEIAYGVAIQLGNQPELFSAFMSSIITQVSDTTLQQCLRKITARGLK